MKKLLAIGLVCVLGFAKAQTWKTEDQYIQKFAPYAVEEMEKYKIPASITLAQGLLETGGGQSRLALEGKNHFGIKVVKDDSLQKTISEWSRRSNFDLVDADENRYGKITDGNIRFINWFYEEYEIPLDPIYTGKMMQKVFELAKKDFFPKGSKILTFHTGGLQGIKGANQFLKSKNRPLIEFENSIF